MSISALWRLNNNKVPQLHPSLIGQHSKLLRCFWEKSNTALFSLFAQKLLWTAATFSICQKLLAELLFRYQKYIRNDLQRYFIEFHKICQFGIILKQLRHFSRDKLGLELSNFTIHSLTAEKEISCRFSSRRIHSVSNTFLSDGTSPLDVLLSFTST